MKFTREEKIKSMEIIFAKMDSNKKEKQNEKAIREFIISQGDDFWKDMEFYGAAIIIRKVNRII